MGGIVHHLASEVNRAILDVKNGEAIAKPRPMRRVGATRLTFFVRFGGLPQTAEVARFCNCLKVFIDGGIGLKEVEAKEIDGAYIAAVE